MAGGPSAQSNEDVLRGLRGLRWLRRATWFCLGFPVVLTGLIVLANWPDRRRPPLFREWGPVDPSLLVGLFYTLVLGGFLVMLTLARRYPRCRGPFHHRGERRSAAQRVSEACFRTNVFTPRCLSCGLHIDGANLSPRPPH